MDGIVFLDVPYAEKDTAKRLGARWDPIARKWYIQASQDPKPFSRWMLQDGTQEAISDMDDAVIRVEPPLYLAEALSSCWRCGKDTTVIALAAQCQEPAEIFNEDPESFDDEDEDFGGMLWIQSIEKLPSELAELLRMRYPFFKKNYSKTAGIYYFMNHCSCGAKLGDFFLHGEPGAAFCPDDEEGGRRVILRLLPIDHAVTLRAGIGEMYPDFVCSHGIRKAWNDPETTAERTGQT